MRPVGSVKRRFSRRALVAGMGGAAASAVALWELGGRGLRSRSYGEEELFREEIGSLVEHDGWLVTLPDKRLMEFPVRYVEGWYAEEKTPEAAWRWSRQAGSVLAPNLGVDATVYIDYDSRAAFFGDRPRTVTVSAGDQVLETFVADAPGRQRRAVALPGGAPGQGEVFRLTLATDRPFVPAEHLPDSQDRRILGLQVYAVEIREGGIPR
jgi:hypothetical protein